MEKNKSALTFLQAVSVHVAGMIDPWTLLFGIPSIRSLLFGLSRSRSLLNQAKPFGSKTSPAELRSLSQAAEAGSAGLSFKEKMLTAGEVFRTLIVSAGLAG